MIVGTNDNSDNLRSGPRSAWLYVGKLHRDSTDQELKAYVSSKGIDVWECELNSSRSQLKSFRVCIPLEALEEVNAPEFWPRGIVVRRYIFRRNEFERGVRLY